MKLVREQLLRGDDVAFHPHHLDDVRDTALAVTHAVHLADHVDRRSDLRAHGAGRQVDAGHADHVFETSQRLARRVRVNRRHRTVMAGVHRLQHVERFFTAALTDDDPVRAHSQRVLQQIAHRDLAGAFKVCGTRLKPYDMRLLQLQFGRVFDRDSSLGAVDHARQRVEQRRLTGAGAT